MKRVVIIGSGNVAEALGYAISSSNNYKLVQIFARNLSRGKKLASELGCNHSHSDLFDADIYIIAVADSAVAEISLNLNFRDAVVAHTAGSVAMDSLGQMIKHRGVIYPLQTLSAGHRVDFSCVPLFIEGSDHKSQHELMALAQELSHNVCEASSQQRMALHLSAVFACNFTNAMYSIAQFILKENNIDPTLLNSLIKETTSKATSHPNAAHIQTGPARRGDTVTMEHHLKMLNNRADLQEIYKTISLNIWETSKKI